MSKMAKLVYIENVANSYIFQKKILVLVIKKVLVINEIL